MKELLQQLAAYNIWANQLILARINELPEELQIKKVPSSFSSLLQTVLHMWDAEAVWWQRMKLLERITKPGEEFKGAMQDAVFGLLQSGKQWNDWIAAVQEHQLQHVFQYQNSKREQFKQPIYQMLIHVFNHGMYHRGQLVTMMRQLGIDKIPPTDFIIWTRKK